MIVTRYGFLLSAERTREFSRFICYVKSICCFREPNSFVYALAATP